MTDIARNLFEKAHLLLQQFPAIVILGARQVGKTVLAKSLGKDWPYFDLEKPADFDRIHFDSEFFFKQHPQHIILDEAQEYPEIFAILRGVIDEKRQEKGRFILTGSSSPEILHHISESLAGRLAIIELGTLKMNEYAQKSLSAFYDLFTRGLERGNIPSGTPPIDLETLQSIWLRGGYPEPLLHVAEENFYAFWMENYHLTYLNRDIAQLFPGLNHLAFRRFLSMLSHLSGTILNRAECARAIEVSEKTAREYLTIVEGTYLWRQIPSFEKAVEKSVIKMPKGYLRDTGLLHYLLGINTLDKLYSHPHVARSFEGFVIEELIKGLNATLLTQWQFYYYRTRNKAEIDLILEGPFGILPIEIKLGRVIDRKKLQTLRHFIKENRLDFGVVINQSDEVLWLTDEIVQIPVGWL
jgi:predicted AAA+ superfamily ATPase